MDEDERFSFAKEIGAPLHLVEETARLGKLPVVNFAAGGIATPADAAMMMQLGVTQLHHPQGSSIHHSHPLSILSLPFPSLYSTLCLFHCSHL